jgi:hypothetical protein
MPEVGRTVAKNWLGAMIMLSGSVGVMPTNREAGLSSQKEPVGFATPTAHGTAGSDGWGEWQESSHLCRIIL